jgi:hypothetical protein
MRLVVAGSGDSDAQALVRLWGPKRAALVTPDDLSTPGWLHQVGGAGRSAAAVGNRVVPADEVEAVVVRLGYVPEHELEGVCPEDRAYAAAEMTAFLLAWLDDRACPVVNRPTPGCLNGPAWRPEQWAMAAGRAGMLVVPVHRRVPADGTPEAPAGSDEVVAIVVGDRCLGGVHPRQVRHARRLAADAGVDLLAVRFAGPGPLAAFLGASAFPDLGDPAIADALDAHLQAMGC